MEAIRDFIEWFANDAGSATATIFPYLLVGLIGLYLLSLLLGYLRVSQVGSGEAEHGGEAAIQLAPAHDGALQAPRGVPYCAVDRLQYPAGARFCTRCERDLTLDCVNCAATLRASDASCYRCGTRTGVADHSPLS